MDNENRIIRKLDKLDSRLDSIEKISAVQAQQLNDHMRRTEIAERRLEIIQTELSPLKTHVNLVTTLTKIAVALLTLIAAYLKFLR